MPDPGCHRTLVQYWTLRSILARRTIPAAWPRCPPAAVARYTSGQHCGSTEHVCTAVARYTFGQYWPSLSARGGGRTRSVPPGSVPSGSARGGEKRGHVHETLDNVLPPLLEALGHDLWYAFGQCRWYSFGL
eukprot:655610-Rhodomonas_salina.3